jgi:hypothetical protein
MKRVKPYLIDLHCGTDAKNLQTILKYEGTRRYSQFLGFDFQGTHAPSSPQSSIRVYKGPACFTQFSDVPCCIVSNQSYEEALSAVKAHGHPDSYVHLASRKLVTNPPRIVKTTRRRRAPSPVRSTYNLRKRARVKKTMSSKIIDYVLYHFPGVTDIADVDPFQGLVRPKVQEVTKTVTLIGCGELKLAPNDTDTLVSARVIMIRYTKNPSDAEPVYVKRTFSHPACAEEDAEADRMLEAMGGFARAVLTIPPKDDSAKSVFIMKETPNCLYLQPAFVRTCMLIDAERNLMHGIIAVPPDVWQGELPDEAVVFDDNQQSVSFKVERYALVPWDHILAWCLKVSDHWRRMRGIFALEMDVTRKDEKDSFVKYFAVADQSFERLKASCIANFLNNKVDKRPLNTLGIETTGYAEVAATFSYLVYPQEVEPAKVAPVTDEHFVPYSQVLQAEVEAIRARESDDEWNKKKMDR